MNDVNPSELLAGSMDEWVHALPSYQRDHVLRMLATSDPVEAATTWLDDSGPKDTAPYGGFRAGAAKFYSNVLVELEKLLCGGAGYEEEKKQLAQSIGAGKMIIVASISTAIAPHVGAAAIVLGPAIAITLGVLGNAGHASACEVLGELIEERKTAGESQAP